MLQARDGWICTQSAVQYNNKMYKYLNIEIQFLFLISLLTDDEWNEEAKRNTTEDEEKYKEGGGVEERRLLENSQIVRPGLHLHKHIMQHNVQSREPGLTDKTRELFTYGSLCHPPTF